MQLFNIIAFTTLLIASVAAQNAHIGSPVDGTSVAAGSQLDIEITRPVRLPCRKFSTDL
jgi:hypothetical protein